MDDFNTVRMAYRDTFLHRPNGLKVLRDLQHMSRFLPNREDSNFIPESRDLVGHIMSMLMSATHPEESVDDMNKALLREPIYRESKENEDE